MRNIIVAVLLVLSATTLASAQKESSLSYSGITAANAPAWLVLSAPPDAQMIVGQYSGFYVEAKGAVILKCSGGDGAFTAHDCKVAEGHTLDEAMSAVLVSIQENAKSNKAIRDSYEKQLDRDLKAFQDIQRTLKPPPLFYVTPKPNPTPQDKKGKS